MNCSRCGVCCEKTQMMLSIADIERLEKSGHSKPEFTRYDKEGFAKLKNRHGSCFFYNPQKHRCNVYRHRPSGCRVYPVILSKKEGIIVDDICPMKSAILEIEIRRKGKKVIELLKRIDREAASHSSHTQQMLSGR